ncbi:MAG: toprim domain-containing protein, partial [Planctomycetota bacterium]
FGKNCICFALRDKQSHVTGLYFRSILESNGDNDTIGRHYYLKDRQGLYPGYPKPGTRKLILTEAIIDAATLERLEELTRDYNILSLYGTNGFTEEHKAAIEDLKELQEIILFFDGDDAGEKAIIKHSGSLHELRPKVKITRINTPRGHDINSLYLAHDRDIFTHLLETRQTLFSSIEDTLPAGAKAKAGSTEIKKDQEQKVSSEKDKQPASANLDTTNPYNLRYTGHILSVSEESRRNTERLCSYHGAQ